MARAVECLLTVLSVWLLISTVSVADAAESKATKTKLLSGDHVVLGTIEEIRSDQARTNIGEVEPRFVPMNVRKDKALSDIQIGDLVEVTVNDQNLLVDVHKVGEVSQHRVVQGQLALLATARSNGQPADSSMDRSSHPTRREGWIRKH